MTNILVINANPKKKSFCKSLAESYVSGAKVGKHSVRYIDLVNLKFNPSPFDSNDKFRKSEPDLLKAQKDITWANHLVFVFPTWWSSFPACLKAFLDRAFSAGFAFKFTKSSPMPKKLLKGKTARLIVTMDSPCLIHKFYFGAPGIKILGRGTLKFCGITPVRETYICSLRKSNEKQRKKWLSQIEELGKKGI